MKRSLLPGPTLAGTAKQSTHTPGPTTTNWDRPKPKRKLTEAACLNCRNRRRRCTGGRPCATCQANDSECIYETNEVETHNQTLKRKYARLQQDRDELKELLTLISTADPARSAEIIGRVRTGQSAGDILKHVQHGDVLLQKRLNSDQHARQVLFSSLMLTSASFDDMVDFIATSSKSGLWNSMPEAAIFRQLRGQKTDLNSLRKLLGFPSAQRRIAISDLLDDQKSSSNQAESTKKKSSPKRGRSPQARVSEPPYTVPAQPWTTLTDDDELTSHLVSVFLEWINPGARLLEQDLFLEAMKSGDLDSEYCSPFLVSSIMALASLSSEHEKVFVQADDYMTRGYHFHEEALRLWDKEEGEPTLVNLQSLCVLFLGCVLRGTDKMGLALMGTLAEVNENVPQTLTRLPGAPRPTAEEAATYRRARRCADWAVHYCDLATSNSILKPAFRKTRPLDFVSLSELPELPKIWTGYPTQQPVPLDRNLIWIETCKLTQLSWEAQYLLFSSDRNHPKFEERVEALAARMIQWRRSLPEALRHRPILQANVIDMHCNSLSVLTVLYSLFKPLGDTQLNPMSPDAIGSDATSEIALRKNSIALRMRGYAFACAREIAVMMGDFRKHHGLKIIVPYMAQAVGVACFLLIQDLSNPATQIAFKEAFRCLLGAGMQLLWARAMARLLHLTAQKTGIALPKAITTTLEAVSDTAWKKGDTEMIRSIWPNYIIVGQAESGESVTMEHLIKKWEKLDI